MAGVFVHSLFLQGLDLNVADSYEIGRAMPLRDFIEMICRGNDLLLFRLIDEQSNLRRHVNIFVGSDNCRRLDGLETIIRNSDEVAVFTAVSGG